MVAARFLLAITFSMIISMTFSKPVLAQQNRSSGNSAILPQHCSGLAAIMVSLQAVCTTESQRLNAAQDVLENLPSNADDATKTVAQNQAAVAAEIQLNCTRDIANRCSTMASTRRMRRQFFCSQFVDSLSNAGLICQAETAALSQAESAPDSPEKADSIYSARWDLTDCINRTISNCR